MQNLSDSMYTTYYSKEVIMEELIRELLENNYFLLAVFMTLAMFILGGILRLIDYVINKLTDNEED